MQTNLKSYDPTTDYMRIQEFLIETFTLYQRPFNWLIDCWNFCRYVVVPIHTYYNIRYFGVPTRPHKPFRDELPGWEATIGIWENERGEIVGVVHSENEEPGEAWFQIHPEYTSLYPEMLDYAEETLADRVNDIGFVKAYINAGTELESIAQARGYRKLNESMGHSEYVIDVNTLPPTQLPEGFVIKSVLEEDNVEKRSAVKALAFGGGYAPSDWAPASVYQKVQNAPDYRKDLDLFIVSPEGEYISFCTIWIDEKNKYGVFEPVGTHVEYQKQGFGRALLMEGFRRMAQHGATRSYMDSNNGFYRKIGFKPIPGVSYAPWIKYFEI